MDFNHVDPKLLASGSDDAKGNQSVNVLLWPLSLSKGSVICVVHSRFLRVLNLSLCLIKDVWPPVPLLAPKICSWYLKTVSHS